MVNKTEEMVGVECQVCHEEAFQLVERGVMVIAKCCPRCKARLDFEREEQTIRDAIKTMEKAERKRYLKEQSFEWARNLHGKKVTLFWDSNTNLVFCSPESEYSVQGTAYQMQNVSGGWGQVRVSLEPNEYHRITYLCHYTLYCLTVKRDMFFAESNCYNIKCPKLQPGLDGQRFGLPLSRDDNGGFYTTVSWGCRKAISEVLEEIGVRDGRIGYGNRD